MANNFNSNFTREVMMNVLDRFEANRVISKNVDTQLFQGKFNPNRGESIDVKRPTDYKSIRTATGDVSGQQQDIITGKATATVQDYITVFVDYDEADEAISMGTDITRFWDDIANRIVIDLETSFSTFAMINSGLRSGTVGEGVDSWAEVASAGALMQSSGVPMNAPWFYALNPFSQVALANEQRSLGVSPDVNTANARATVNDNFAGLTVKTATTLDTFATGTGADRSGTVASNPDVTYLTAKDTMTQVIAVTGFQANLVVSAGESVTIVGRNRLNLSTRKPIIDASGAQVVFTGTVVSDVTLGVSGDGNLVITGPAIFEASGAYNTTDSAVTAADVITLGGAADSVIQPNLFWHRDAFTIASVPIKRLRATDTIMQTEDGLQLRTTMFSNGETNKQKLRIDLRPAFGVMNPFFAGHGYGTA